MKKIVKKVKKEKKEKKDINVLIVEEDYRWRSKIKEYLHLDGYESIEESSEGTHAWSKLNRHQVDVVICNYKLPHMSGLGLLKIMMGDEVYCNIPFMMLSDSAEKKDILEAAKAGVSGFLLKPFNYEKFIVKFESIISEIDPLQAEIKKLFELGKQYVNQEKFEKALLTFKKILKLNEEAEAYYQIGQINETQGNLDDAARAFRKAIQLNTTFVKAYEALGKTYKEMGDDDNSEKYFEKSGDLYLKREMLEHAEFAYQSANEINPNNIGIYNSLGIVYRRKGLFDLAIEQYRNALKVNPDDENIFYNLGRAYLENKEIENAKVHFKKALEIRPDFEEALTMLKAISIGFSDN